MDADGQAINGLWCWVDDWFGAVRARGLKWSILFADRGGLGARLKGSGRIVFRGVC